MTRSMKRMSPSDSVVSRHQLVDGVGVVRRCDVPAGNLGLVGDEEVIEMPGQETGGCRLVNHEVDDVLSVEVPGVAQESLLAVVMVLGAVLEIPVEPAQRIARDLRPRWSSR